MLAHLLVTAGLLLIGPADQPDAPYFAIAVVDDQTGRGVPLVELRTVNNIRYCTDSAGVVAINEPGLMDQDVYLHISSDGYEFPADGFGYRGRAFHLRPGGKEKVAIHRVNIAQRLYRVTGQGIYRDSVLVGRTAPLVRPVLNAQVMGSDSVVNAVYRGRIYWFWGDTGRPAYPLGNFHVPGATSLLPQAGGLDPEIGVNLDYFVASSGFAKETAHVEGKGPTWISGLVTLPDDTGRERLYAAYAKIRPGSLNAYQRGCLVFDDDAQRFRKIIEFDVNTAIRPDGHPFKHTVDGIEYVYFATPYPYVRVHADARSYTDLSQYETFTCLADGGDKGPRLDRDDHGMLRYIWKRAARPMSADLETRLIEKNLIKPNERMFQMQEAGTGQPVVPHSGSVAWNPYRRRWTMIFTQFGGTSLLGEVWYAEADAPTGRWRYAVKIATHDHYSFYNPKQHPVLAEQRGRIVFFEGTYSTLFSGNTHPTARYDYNQIMYELDLDDPRLALPAASQAETTTRPAG